MINRISIDHYHLTPLSSLEQADVVTFLVAHKEFKDLDIKTDLDFCGGLK